MDAGEHVVCFRVFEGDDLWKDTKLLSSHMSRLRMIHCICKIERPHCPHIYVWVVGWWFIFCTVLRTF